MARLIASAQLTQYNCLEPALRYVLHERDNAICFDLSQVVFVRPVGVAKTYLIATSLIRSGYNVTVVLPTNAEVRSYLQRCGILQALKRTGIAVNGPVEPYNVGNARSLIEFTEIRTDLDGHENARLVDVTCFRGFLQDHQIRDKGALRAWMEICSNAAEHSHATSGALMPCNWAGHW